MSSFNDLNTLGFVLVKDVLNQEEINELQLEWENSHSRNNTRYKDGILVGLLGPKVKEKLSVLMEQISNETDIKLNRIRDRISFYLPYNREWGFHQDHEPYYIFQDQTKTINFWIPIRKPNPAQTGLSFMPTDLLLKLEPEFTQNHILGKGAKMFTELDDGTTEVKDNETGEIYILNRHLSDYEISPNVSVGDVLVVRGDNVHRTQDNKTDRLAVSIWAANDSTVLSQEKFFSGAEIKTRRFIIDNESFKDVLNAFSSTDNPYITIGDVFKVSK